MSFTTRRIVTGHDAQGRSLSTMARPCDNQDSTDGAERDTGLASSNGSVLRIVEMAPGHRSPMHRTQSLDYGIVLAGEIDLELEEGRIVSLNVGDVVVQRGTIHAWINRGDSPARMAFVLLSAAPLA